MQAHHLVRRLEDCAAPLLRLHARVSRATRDRHLVVDRPLASRDDVAIRASALEHERHVALGRDAPNVAVATGEPISSSGFAMTVNCSKGSPPAASTASSP